jgi:hypothetical protein
LKIVDSVCYSSGKLKLSDQIDIEKVDVILFGYPSGRPSVARPIDIAVTEIQIFVGCT